MTLGGGGGRGGKPGIIGGNMPGGGGPGGIRGMRGGPPMVLALEISLSKLESKEGRSQNRHFKRALTETSPHQNYLTTC